MEVGGSKGMKNGRRSNREKKIALLQDVLWFFTHLNKKSFMFLCDFSSFKVVMFLKLVFR